MRKLVALALLLGCGGGDAVAPDAADVPTIPTTNLDREIISTGLAVDVMTHAATATIVFGASDAPGATLEVGDLMIDSVMFDGAPLATAATTAMRLDLALPPSAGEATVVITYHYALHEGFAGVSKDDYTLVWPYFCGNVFPCHSAPADGTTFTLALTGVASGDTAVYPTTIPADAPSYQVAWAIDAYQELPVGTTTAGTQVSMWHRANELAKAQQGSANLVDAVDWFETTLGPYRFGPKLGGVSVSWGPGALGGMEHHPYWHVAAGALNNSEVNVHEAAHGWFGDGIRIACWEDFVLSEGTVTYLAGRALDVVAPATGAGVWAQYASEYGGILPDAKVWPEGCNQIDIIADDLFSNAPYMRGAFFYRAVALKVGAEMLDAALAAFYRANAGKSARMADMLTTIQTVTGYDPTTCANMFLRSTTKPVAGTACP